MDNSIESTPEFEQLVKAQEREDSPPTTDKLAKTWEERALAAEAALWYIREGVMGHARTYLEDGDCCEHCSDNAGDLDELIDEQATDGYPLDALEAPPAAARAIEDNRPDNHTERKVYALRAGNMSQIPTMFIAATNEGAARAAALDRCVALGLIESARDSLGSPRVGFYIGDCAIGTKDHNAQHSAKVCMNRSTKDWDWFRARAIELESVSEPTIIHECSRSGR